MKKLRPEGLGLLCLWVSIVISFSHCKGQENRRKGNGCENGQRQYQKSRARFFQGQEQEETGKTRFFSELILLRWNEKSRNLKRRRRELGEKKKWDVYGKIKRRGTLG